MSAHPTATDFAAIDAVSPLPPDQLPRQWALTRRVEDLPNEWSHRTLDGWHLANHPDAHVCNLYGKNGRAIGWVIEPLIYLEGGSGTMPGTDLVLDVAGEDQGELEQALYGRDQHGRSHSGGLQGAWVAIVFAGTPGARTGRVYLGATHSVVYHRDRAVVATSHNLVPDIQRDVELSEAFDPLGRNSYFSFGLTPFVGLERLLPNHHLDLDTFDPCRHWPKAPLPRLASGEEGAIAVVGHSQRVIAALLDHHPQLKVFLSAGRDSRAVLGMLRPFVGNTADVLLSTSVGADVGSRVDLQAARRLAEITQLPHEVTERTRRDPEPEVEIGVFVRIGASRGGSILSGAAAAGAQGRAGDGRFMLGGMGGEVARGFFWPAHQPGHRDIAPEVLVTRTKSPKTHRVLEAASQWREGLPASLTPADVLDLTYIEQRLGCWESLARYAYPGRPLVLSPMTTAFNLETMLRLPERYRAAGLLQEDMVASCWPELLEVPFNEGRGLLGFEQRLRRRSGPVRRKVRRVLDRRPRG